MSNTLEKWRQNREARIARSQRHPEVGNVWDIHHIEKAAEIASQGGVIGFANRGVNALWGNGADPNFVEKIVYIKGDNRKNAPMGATLPSEMFAEYLDYSRISADHVDFFKHHMDVIGSLCFVRAPIKASYVDKVPGSVLSVADNGVHIMQNWAPAGHKPAELLVESMLRRSVFPAITSMNRSGEPEIVDMKGGRKFTTKHPEIALFLTDPRYERVIEGSYTILEVGVDDAKSLSIVREGNVPGKVIDMLVSTEMGKPLGQVSTEGAKPAKYPQVTFPIEELGGLSIEPMRQRVLDFINDVTFAKSTAGNGI